LRGQQEYGKYYGDKSFSSSVYPVLKGAAKEIVASITWNSVDGYFVQLQPLGYYNYNVLVDVGGQQMVFNVCQYVTAYQIPAHRHSKIRVKYSVGKAMS